MILRSDGKGNGCIWKLQCHCIQILYSDIYIVYLIQVFGPQSLKHLSKNDIAALCEKMNDSATFLDKQTITIHIHHRGLRCIQYTFFWS